MQNKNNSNFILNNLITRFKQMLKKGIPQYFEIPEIKELTNYFIDREEISEAKSAIDLGLKLHGESYEINLLHLKYQIANENLTGAKKLIRKISKFYPQKGELSLYQAIISIYENKYDKAKELIRKGIKISGLEETDYLFIPIGYVFIKMNHYLDGALYLKKYYETYEDSDDLLLDIARAYVNAKKFRLAESFYNKYLDHFPFSALGWFELGKLQSLFDGEGICIDSFDYALSIDSGFKEVYLAKGDFFYDDSLYNLSLECYREYEKIEANGLIFYRIGRSLSGRENFNLAEFYYKMAEEKDYGSMAFDYDRALNLYKKEENSLAYDKITKIIENEDSNPKYWHLAALISEAMNHKETAKKFYNEALKLDDTNSEYWANYADIYYKESNFENALEVLSSAITKHLIDYKIMYRVAICAMRLNKNDLAQVFFQHAVDDNPHKTLNELLNYYPQAEKFEFIQEALNKQL